MIPCKHCNTLNSLDSTFCKRCGTGLPEEQLAEAKAELEKVVDEGFSALNQGRLEEASAIAESATASDPSSVRGLSLKAACHERRGEIVEALECAERIVELNPNSELDKIKRNQLRSALAASVRTQGQPGRWVAVLAGVSATVLVFCVGLVIWRKADQAQIAQRVALNSPPPVADQMGGSRLDTVPNTSASAAQGNQSQPQQQAPPQAQQQPDAQREDNSNRSDTNTPELPNARRTLPSADPDEQPEIVPLQPSGPIGGASTGGNSNGTGSSASGNRNSTRTESGGDPAPAPETGTQRGTGAQPPKDPGQIHIDVHADGASRIGSSGSQAVGSNNAGPAQMYYRVGEERLLSGNYSGAATAFEQALKNGGDPILLNHYLGRTYRSLGRNSDAIAAFQRAIDASNQALTSGQGNPARIRGYKDADESAITQLRGG
jgi:tetratricopeptide (TPR) repeat protein